MKLQHFESFDSYAAALFHADARVFLLGSRDGGWRTGHLDVDGIDVQRGVTQVPNLCEASGWATHLTLLLPEPAPARAWLNGVPFSQDSMGVLAPGEGFVFRAAGPNDWISIALPLASDLLIDDTFAAQTLRRWANAADMVKTDPVHVAALREAALLSMAPACPPALGRRLIEQRLRNLIAARVPHDKNMGRPSVRLPKVCAVALAIFRDAQRAVHVDELCRRMKISERSLRDVFQVCFGMSPAHYLALRKLHDVYLDLAYSTHEQTVADCFLQHGYPYSTYAAARYHALFLETPSETRRRLRPHINPS
ncbi:helix-turn-helix domain-containing protein [Achromobacter kerstersii]|uniref:helix-turn-helix domain-containing protein n=1 Tax=Achromobacter kerstersii TaxID=1353890 RepID=UPI0006C7018F|nr:helix-turn-helix domain-containing protein [Achromobacter kerstersii]CUJ59798.1 transcriptional regulator EutR [Achromobacter kerstersii]